MQNDVPEIWQLEPDQPDWLEHIITRLLLVGVPPTAIGKAFDLDPHAIKEHQAQLNIKKYGTAEISEAVYFLMWRAYEDAHAILDSAPAATRTRFITTLLSRQSSIVGKESPQELARMREELSGLFAGINIPDPQTPSIYAPSSFTPADREADDPEEGSES